MKTYSYLAAKVGFQTRNLRYATAKPSLSQDTPPDQPKPTKPICITNDLGTHFADENADFFKDDIEKRDKEAAQATISRLRYIQLGLCLVMLGGYVRLTATAMNVFAPQTLDEAFETDIDFNSSHGFASLLLQSFEHWPLTILLMGTAICMTMDFIYFWAITTKDQCELDEKLAEFETAKREKENETELEAQKITTILNKTKKDTKRNLQENHARIIEIIEQDVLVQELLIRSDIDRQYLLEKLRAEGANANIASILEKLSIDVSLKDYQSSHKDFRTYARSIEYIQAIKIPLRYTSLLLLLNDKAFDYPDITKWTGTKPIQEGEPVYEWVLIGSVFLLALMVYAFHLEFKKNDNNTALDIKTRELKNKHHNALLSTLLLTLNRKLDNNEGSIVTAQPVAASPEEKLLGVPLNSALYLKLVISFLCLGSLGRRPFTIFGLSGEENADDSTLAALVSFVAVFIIVDVIYISLSVVEEKWQLNNKRDKNKVLDACKQHGKDLEGAINAKALNKDEALLAKELENSEKNATSRFKEEHPTLQFVKKTTEQLLCVKFGLRALSVAWALIQIRATDDFKKEHLGALSAPEAAMVFAFATGFVLGLLAQSLNNKKDEVLNPDVETRQYTKNTLLFFRDEKPGQLSRRPECTVKISGEINCRPTYR